MTQPAPMSSARVTSPGAPATANQIPLVTAWLPAPWATA
jgi:hypothetical protein